MTKIYSTCHKGHTVCATGRLSLLSASLPGSVFQISKRSLRPAKVLSYIYSVHLFHHDQDHTNTLAHILTQYGLTYWWTRMPLALLVNRWCVWQQIKKKIINRQLLILPADIYKKKIILNVTTIINGTAI